MSNFFTAADLVHSYNRAEGLEDGVLVDVTSTAKEAGIRFPVAMTIAAYENSVAWTRKEAIQDVSGRLWDVVYMLGAAIRRASNGVTTIPFTVYVVPNVGKGRRPKPVHLVAVCGPGDHGEPVITILMPNED